MSTPPPPPASPASTFFRPIAPTVSQNIPRLSTGTDAYRHIVPSQIQFHPISGVPPLHGTFPAATGYQLSFNAPQPHSFNGDRYGSTVPGMPSAGPQLVPPPRPPSQMPGFLPASNKPRQSRKRWENDSVGGGPTSLDVLLEWLTTGNNYGNYRGGAANGGKSKDSHAEEIRKLMSKKGLSRDTSQIRQKISSIEESFKTASDWLENTGQGIKDDSHLSEDDKKSQISSYINKLCPLYDQIVEVMRDRPSARPLITNEVRPRLLPRGDSVSSSSESSRTSLDSAYSSTSLSASTDSSSVSRRQKRSRNSGIMDSWQESQLEATEIAKKRVAIEENRFALERENADSLRKKMEAESQKMKAEEQKMLAEEKKALAEASAAEARAEIVKMEAIAKKLQLRKAMKEEGISQEEIDKTLPL